MEAFLWRLESHDWLSEPNSPGDARASAAPALAAAWRDDPGTCEMLMGALGNRHEDAWFPVLPRAMPFLQAVIGRASGIGADAAMYLLECFCNTFSAALEDAEPGREWARIVETREQRELDLDDALQILVPTLLRIRVSGRTDAEQAASLLAAIDQRRRRRSG